ncbi:MAG: phage baseplate assembly protein V [Cyanobacteria bacterium J06588_5]
MSEFFGKYRGQVTNNSDPLGLGRLQVSVPAVYGDGSNSWAMPCVPFAGNGVGWFALPPTGANIWVEFEGGDPDYPIWAGCFWGATEAPALIAGKKILKTDAASITIDDLPGGGGITIETAVGMKVSMTMQGIEIDNGQGATISLTGPQISFNNGAMEVV